MRWWTVAALGMLVGCGPVDIDGSVDGEPVGGAREALWDTIEIQIPFIGDIEYTVVLLTDIQDGCEAYQELTDAAQDDHDCESLCEDYLATAATWDLPTDAFWTVSMAVNTSDDASGDFDVDLSANLGEASASFSDIDASAFVDQSSCESICEDQELLDSNDEEAEDGSIVLEPVEDDELPGTFTLDFGGEDSLEGEFRAVRCDLTDWFGF